MIKTLKTTLLWWLGITLATIGLCYATQIVAEFFGVELPDQENLALIKDSSGWNIKFIALCTYIACITPIIEEFFFRYLLWKYPDPRRAWVGAIISSVIFSAAHYLFQPFPDNAFVALFAFGMMQCALYKKTGTIWSPVLTHALFNATNLILLFTLPA